MHTGKLHAKYNSRTVLVVDYDSNWLSRMEGQLGINRVHRWSDHKESKLDTGTRSTKLGIRRALFKAVTVNSMQHETFCEYKYGMLGEVE